MPQYPPVEVLKKVPSARGTVFPARSRVYPDRVTFSARLFESYQTRVIAFAGEVASTLSLDAGDSGSGDEPMPVADTLGSEDEGLEGVEYRESLKPMLEQLPPREKKILMLRFFKNMTQSEIAAEIGISQMHVSRLLARTLAQLREGLLIDE